MEDLSRLVTASLVRHGFDRPLDYRRLQWSRWFRCESHHSLLQVPSQPGVFALAEEIPAHAGAAASAVQRTVSETKGNDLPKPAGSLGQSSVFAGQTELWASTNREGHDFSRADQRSNDAALAAEAHEPRRLLAVSQFFDADDMAYTLDRMLAFASPWRARLNAGRHFVRYVVVQDPIQRRTISSALNQWIADSAGKATGAPSFPSSLDLAPQSEFVSSHDVRT